MSTDKQESSSGSVPHAYRNRLFWNWVPGMPKALPSGFVSLLYALGSAADTSGRLRFKNGTIIRVSAIAKAMRADVKDVRRYLAAAIAAGVVAIDGEHQPGAPIAYAILVVPNPDWGAAEASLKASKRHRTTRENLPWKIQNRGGTPPTVQTPNPGGTPPTVDDPPETEPGGDAPPPTLGVRPPRGLGVRPPHIPGSTHVLLHDGAEVVDQPQVGGDPAPQKIDLRPEEDATAATAGFVRCAKCHTPMVPRPGRTTHAHCA